MDNTTIASLKRRVLAPIDANSISPSPRVLDTKDNIDKLKSTSNTTATEASSSLKRSLHPTENSSEESSRPDKKPCTKQISPRRQCLQPETRTHSQSPDPVDSADSSMFDQSSHDVSQVTVFTEPDVAMITQDTVELSPPRRRQRAMTREEARNKAEMLRLRLGLASYKVKTNQIEVPLDRLQRRSLETSQQAVAAGTRARSNTTGTTVMSLARDAFKMVSMAPPRTTNVTPTTAAPVAGLPREDVELPAERPVSAQSSQSTIPNVSSDGPELFRDGEAQRA